MKRSFYLGLILFLLLVIVFILNAGFSSVDMSNTLAPFSLTHPLGTDTYGRDLLARLSLGALISLSLWFFMGSFRCAQEPQFDNPRSFPLFNLLLRFYNPYCFDKSCTDS